MLPKYTHILRGNHMLKIIGCLYRMKDLSRAHDMSVRVANNLSGFIMQHEVPYESGIMATGDVAHAERNVLS